MRRNRKFLDTLLPAIFLWAHAGPIMADEIQRVVFEQQVRPILKVACFHCHGEEEFQGGLDLRLVRLMRAGGDTGTAVVPGDPDASLLWRRIAADEMPDGRKKLTHEQKEVIRQWIEQGALTARPEPENPDDARFSLEELQHWAFQPVMSPVVPQPTGYPLRTPIDRFIAQRLQDHKLSFSPMADRPTLIRRLTFDLWGIPPTPTEVRQFVADKSPDAYERLVERLLASPQFGVRWGRHWLDVAGYAESDGGMEGESLRPHAWRYRDYVINAFNTNQPINEFIVEQLAGDELTSSEIRRDDPRQLELFVATGFLRMAPDTTQQSNTLANRNLAVADSIKVVSSAILGLTVACAQCHDHKYDPIGIDDYYRLRAIFDPVFPLANWQPPQSRLIDFTTAEVRAKSDEIEAQAIAIEKEIDGRRHALGAKIQESKLADVPAAERDAARAAVLTEPGQRTAEQIALLDRYPMVKPVSDIVGLLIEYDGTSYRAFEKEYQNVSELRATKPAACMVMATREQPNVTPTSAVFFRGDPESPRAEVQPADLMIVTRNRRNIDIPPDDPLQPGTGRRLAYARQLTDGTHPLTARVFVNRVWHHHFGRGLVPTPGDFGIAGERPSHYELLDWLADDFVRHGWDHKRLHRMIVLSTTYQQVSRRTPELDAIDPENALVGRMNLLRLDAESIRDALLSVAEQRDDSFGGPSVPVTESLEGKVVLGVQTRRDGLVSGVDSRGTMAGRRSAYIEVRRRLPLNVLATFDQPEMNPNCDIRRRSTVATQALWFLNDELIVEHSNELASRLSTEYVTSESQIVELFQRLFGSLPTSDDLRACQEFVINQARHFRPSAAANEKSTGNMLTAEQYALSALCQALLASNRFLYVD